MLKFGQIIDLDLLDRIGESKGAEDLRESLQKQEAQHRKELERRHKDMLCYAMLCYAR